MKKPRKPGKRPQRPPSRSPARQAPAARPQKVDPYKGKRLVVGQHSISEALKVRPKKISELWLRPRWEDSQALTDLHTQAERHRIRVEIKSIPNLDRIAASHQGACAVVGESPAWDEAQLSQPGPQMILILDGIEDPQNLGAILRTAWLMGVQAIFIPQERSAPLTPAAMKAASGAAEHVPVEVVSSLPQFIEELKRHEFWIYGLAEAGTQMLWQLKLAPKIAWVVGSEDKGLRSTVASRCDELVRIPQISGGSSYNASVSAAIVMAEGARQHLGS